jgi:hypothetical protein
MRFGGQNIRIQMAKNSEARVARRWNLVAAVK